MSKERYFDVDVSTYTYAEIIEQVKLRMDANLVSTIIAVNPEKLMAARKNELLKKLINSSTFQIPDGVGILIASKMAGGNIRHRVTGVDMMKKLLEMAADTGKKVFLYGAKPAVVEQAATNIKVMYPAINIVGIQDGYEQNEEVVVQKINDAGADLVFVALGSPKQELWIERNMERLHAKVFQGVGGSFDVFSGTVKRAPYIFRKTGFEWLYRLLSNPKRIGRQTALIEFMYRLVFKK